MPGNLIMRVVVHALNDIDLPGLRVPLNLAQLMTKHAYVPGAMYRYCLESKMRAIQLWTNGLVRSARYFLHTYHNPTAHG